MELKKCKFKTNKKNQLLITNKIKYNKIKTQNLFIRLFLFVYFIFK